MAAWTRKLSSNWIIGGFSERSVSRSEPPMRKRLFATIDGKKFEYLPPHAQDIEICYATADRVGDGEKVTPEAKTAGHEACQRALAATSSIMQKQQIQEADFDIVGRPKNKSN